MKPEALLEQLETCAGSIGVKVSYEQLAATVGHGGLCRVKGQFRVIIDKRATTGERITTLAAAIASVISPEQLAAQPPKLRDTIEIYSNRSADAERGTTKKAS